jgi:hypothetical protein
MGRRNGREGEEGFDRGEEGGRGMGGRGRGRVRRDGRGRKGKKLEGVHTCFSFRNWTSKVASNFLKMLPENPPTILVSGGRDKVASYGCCHWRRVIPHSLR